jgi:hypothetical protein
VLLSFAAKGHDLEGPRTRRHLYLCYIFKAIKSGKGDALCQEQGLFVATWAKRMAPGGTRPADSVFALKKCKSETDYLPQLLG